MTDVAEDLATPSQRMLRVTTLGRDERRQRGEQTGEAVVSSTNLFAGQIMGKQIGAAVGSTLLHSTGSYLSQTVPGPPFGGVYGLRRVERTYEALSTCYGAPVAFDPALARPTPYVFPLATEQAIYEQAALCIIDETDVEFLSGAVVVQWASLPTPAFLVDAGDLEEVRAAEAERLGRFAAALQEEDDAWVYAQED
jgi:hypothetical protein